MSRDHCKILKISLATNTHILVERMFNTFRKIKHTHFAKELYEKITETDI